MKSIKLAKGGKNYYKFSSYSDDNIISNLERQRRILLKITNKRKRYGLFFFIILMTITFSILLIKPSINGMFSYEIDPSIYGATIDGKIEINKPVNWIKNIEVNEQQTSLMLPKDISNLVITNKYNGNKQEIKKENIIVNKVYKSNWLTGFIIKNIEEETEVKVTENAKELEIRYQTKGPESFEQVYNNYKKQITIQSEMHYKHVIASTRIT